MLRRIFTAALAAVFLVGAGEPEPIPAVLEPHIVNGRFEAGDFGFLRGAFEDASEEEKAAYDEFLKWRQQCQQDALAELREKLVARGFAAETLEVPWSEPLLCRMTGTVPFLADYSSFAEFQAELDQVRPVYDAYILAVRNAEMASRLRNPDLGDHLQRRTILDQMIRLAMSWGQGAMSGAPELTPTGLAILRSVLGMEMARQDHDNTTWLKGVVAENGWPRLSDVGEDASQKAWLLVQHADADPLFQLEALELMEPLVAEGEVSPQNYAYLYDRVRLKVAGKQRYGTQMHCPAGEYEPQPLEDESGLDAYRAEVGLPPIAEYAQMMLDNYGPCTPPPER